MCDVGRFHYSQVHAFGSEIFADAVYKKQRNIWGYLEMEALTFFETRVVENELETRVTEL